MRADQAKTIPVSAYLEYLGVKPTKQRLGGRELWYHSPLRQGDSTPSFKIDTILNRWFDHGLGRGGNTLDLAVELQKASVREALHHLERSGLYDNTRTPQTRFTSLQMILENRKPAIEKEKMGSSAFKLISDGALKHPALLQYLETRKIPRTLAEKYLKQIIFSPADGSKRFFALGWKNGTGYEARNALFKGFVGTGKDITYLKHPQSAVCAIFEGFFDFLSYLAHHRLTEPDCAVIVLNSGALRGHALSPLLTDGYTELRLFLDNDQMGNETTVYFQELLSSLALHDMRFLYQDFKDFNEMHLRHPAP
jgi:hypothetical protein